MNIFISILILIFLIIVALFLMTSLTGAPYVPTLKPGLKEAFKKLYPLGKKDLIIDLGAGDGTVLSEATKCGAKAIGVEINPILALIMKHRFRNDSRVKIKCKNLYHFTFPKETTVIYTFAVSLHIEPIYRKIQSEANRLKKPIYFISNAFDIPNLKPKAKVNTFYLYKITPKASDEH